MSSEKILTVEEAQLKTIGSNYQERYGFYDRDVTYDYCTPRGLNRDIIQKISHIKNEPEWMLDQRLRAYDIFSRLPGKDHLQELNLQNIQFLAQVTSKASSNWHDVPENVQHTFERLGIPETEKNDLNGLTAQFDSGAVYNHIFSALLEQGVIFTDTDDALRRYPELVNQYFGSIVSPDGNRYASLNHAVWSGGTFLYVPKGITIEMPLHAYYRLNTRSIGHFEHTLIILEEDATVHFVEGCTAPIYHVPSLHSGVVEMILKPGSHCRFTAIQNWSKDVYNFATIAAAVHHHASIELVDGNIGSCLTKKHPRIELVGEKAHADVLSISFASRGQIQDAGVDIIHNAPHTTSKVVSKSISKDGGRAIYRGLLQVNNCAKHAKSQVACDSLLLDDQSRSDTYPTIEINEQQVQMGHEATVTQVGEEQLFYLMSRGLSEDEANALIVSGFIEPFIKALPMSYALELNRLIQIQLEGSIG